LDDAWHSLSATHAVQSARLDRAVVVHVPVAGSQLCVPHGDSVRIVHCTHAPPLQMPRPGIEAQSVLVVQALQIDVVVLQMGAEAE